ncbi:MAG: IPT/TIG domain-containing protein [Bacteroidota bacterium]
MKHKIFLFAISVFFIGNLFATTPVITSFSPSSGAVGTLVTITGTNLTTPTAFTIGGTAAIVVSNSGTTLVGMVMPGAVTGTIVITTAGGTASSSGNFTVTATPYPSIQQGYKLVGIDATEAARQGQSVAISADGNTAIVGGSDDNGGQGAAWVYTRTGSTWTLQGSKLVGSGGSAHAGHTQRL